MACESKCESPAKISLQVNGESVELNGFVASMVTETVLGMLKPLRGVDDIQSLRLEIERSA